jgi:hypothetical protein
MTFGNIRAYVHKVPPHHIAHQGWISKVEEGVDQGWQLAIDFDHDQRPIQGARWRLKASDTSVTAKRLSVISEEDSSDIPSDTEFPYMNDHLANFASSSDDTDSDSESEAEEQEYADGEDGAISDPEAWEEVEEVSEVEAESANEFGDEEEMDEVKSDGFTGQSETEPEPCT